MQIWMKRDMYILSCTWRCIPSADHTTVHSESAMEFTSGFPSDVPQKGTHFPLIQQSHHTPIHNTHANKFKTTCQTNYSS